MVQGFSSGGSNSNLEGVTTGLGNALGRYAGNPSGTSDVVKMLIENPWASKWEFVDDVVTAYNSTYEDYRDVYVGQSLVPDDDYTGMTKVAEIVSSNYAGSTSAFANSIVTDNEAAWGMFADYAGSDSTGLCDKHWSQPSAQRLCVWGGGSADGSADGVSCLVLNNALSYSSWSIGARPAFVFD